MSEKPLKILLIEDDPGHARLIKAMLVDASTASTLNLPVTLVHADCLSTGLERLSQNSSFDLILLDLGLPESQGLTTFNRVHAQAPKVPIVAVTALMDETIGVKAIQAGAQDYLVKGRMDSNVLVRSIRYAIERKHAEAQLEKNRINYLNLIENSADGFVVTGRDGAILFVNPAAEAIFGRTLEELKGELFGFTIMAGESTEIDITRRGGETGTGEMRVTETEWEGEPAYLVSIRDITERKQAEDERERILKDLEIKSAEMERFVYAISHELRSPLATVQGFVSLLRDDIKERKDEEEVNHDLKFIENGVTTMEHLLRESLDITRIGRVENPPGDIPFGEIVQEALKQTAAQIKSSGVEVAVAEGFPGVHVDRMRIMEVLLNLIENSTKYLGDQPQPKIAIGHRKEGEETIFFVQDNGIGLDKSQHEKVFELFYKVDKDSTGAGTGLAIVRRIIEVHNGRIWIESEKGKGCTVCFTLPVQ